MNNRLFVGGLPWAADDRDLREAFAAHGTVTDSKVVLDRETGRSRGFGFVTFETEEQAAAAIAALDGNQLGGRTVTVKVAEERRPRGPRSFGGGGGYTEERRGRRSTMEGPGAGGYRGRGGGNPGGGYGGPRGGADQGGGGYGDRNQGGGGYGDRNQGGGGYGDRNQGGGGYRGGGGGGGYRGGGGGGGYRGGGGGYGGGGGGYGGGGGGGYGGGGGGGGRDWGPSDAGGDEGKPGRNMRNKKRGKGKKRFDDEEW